MPDATLLFGDSYRNPSILYRTGFLAPDPVVYLESDGQGTLLVSTLEFGRARAQSRVDRVANFEDYEFTRLLKSSSGPDDAYAQMIRAWLQQAGVERVKVEPDFPLGLARALEARDVVVECDRPLFGEARRRKRPDEVEAVAATQRAAQEAMRAAEDILRDADVHDGVLYHQGEPLTSRRLIGAIETELLLHGCGTDGSTIAAGGPGGADPHNADTGQILADQPVIIDIFPYGNQSRYFGDITRTFVPGTPPPEWVRMWDAVKAAQQAALDTIKAGVNARDVHIAVCRTLYEAGFSTMVEGYRRDGVATMNHGTGHGVGLEIHEAPRLADIDIVLVEGDVVTVEPGLYDPKIGGVRIEDTVVVTADGCRNLTDYPKDWRL